MCCVILSISSIERINDRNFQQQSAVRHILCCVDCENYCGTRCKRRVSSGDTMKYGSTFDSNMDEFGRWCRRITVHGIEIVLLLLLCFSRLTIVLSIAFTFAFYNLLNSQAARSDLVYYSSLRKVEPSEYW